MTSKTASSIASVGLAVPASPALRVRLAANIAAQLAGGQTYDS
jgi:hypothetical protein